MRCVMGSCTNLFFPFIRCHCIRVHRKLHALTHTFIHFCHPVRVWPQTVFRLYSRFGDIVAANCASAHMHTRTRPTHTRLHGSYVFGVSSRSEIRFFPASLSRGTGERYFLLFGVVWAPLGHPSALLWAPMGAYLGKELWTDFGCQNDRFRGFPANEGNVSSKSSWLRARNKSLTLWYHGS